MAGYRAICRLQEGPRLASFVAWALPRAAGVRELTVRFTNHHQAMKFQASLTLALWCAALIEAADSWRPTCWQDPLSDGLPPC